MKKYRLENESVRILRPLQIKKSEPGKPTVFGNLVDKEGNWVQIEILTGANKGNRRPITIEKLK
jgi:hypothetical protein